MSPPLASFAARLAAKITETGNVLCVGIDPHPGLMHPLFGGTDAVPGSPEALTHLEAFCSELIEAATGKVPAVKPQAALFEQHGPGGMQVLAQIAHKARAAGLLVIMDAKRGDIGSTAEAYASAWLGPDAPFPSDAVTINPYLGLDSLMPFITQASEVGAGLFILARTSNAGSRDLQQLDASGTPIWAHLARLIAPVVTDHIDAAAGFSSIGIVAGATGPDEARALRTELPTAPFLIPGYGAQGASAADALAGLIRDNQGKLTGGVVNASRGISHCSAAQSASDITSWRMAVNDALSHATDALAY